MIKEVFLENSKGQKLSAYLNIPEKSGKYPALIRLHGFISNKEGTSRIVQEKLQDDFVSLIFDYHGHGKSEGDFKDFTVTSALDDCQAALDYVLSLEQVDKNKIAVIGTSLGGMLGLLLTARNPKIAALAVSCPVVDFKEVFSKSENIELWKTQGWINALGESGFKIKYQFFEDGSEYNIYQEAEKIQCPVFVISGDQDEYIPVEHLKKLMEHLKKGKLEIIPGADHRFSQHHQYHLKQMIDFIKENL